MNLKHWTNEQRGRPAELARLLGVRPPVVHDWITGKKAIPAIRCKAIESITMGAVTCREMRPDDWRDYWPELEQDFSSDTPVSVNQQPAGQGV